MWLTLLMLYVLFKSIHRAFTKSILVHRNDIILKETDTHTNETKQNKQINQSEISFHK